MDTLIASQTRWVHPDTFKRHADVKIIESKHALKLLQELLRKARTQKARKEIQIRMEWEKKRIRNWQIATRNAAKNHREWLSQLDKKYKHHGKKKKRSLKADPGMYRSPEAYKRAMTPREDEEPEEIEDDGPIQDTIDRERANPYAYMIDSPNLLSKSLSGGMWDALESGMQETDRNFWTFQRLKKGPNTKHYEKKGLLLTEQTKNGIRRWFKDGTVWGEEDEPVPLRPEPPMLPTMEDIIRSLKHTHSQKVIASVILALSGREINAKQSDFNIKEGWNKFYSIAKPYLKQLCTLVRRERLKTKRALEEIHGLKLAPIRIKVKRPQMMERLDKTRIRVCKTLSTKCANAIVKEIKTLYEHHGSMKGRKLVNYQSTLKEQERYYKIIAAEMLKYFQEVTRFQWYDEDRRILDEPEFNDNAMNAKDWVQRMFNDLAIFDYPQSTSKKKVGESVYEIDNMYLVDWMGEDEQFDLWETGELEVDQATLNRWIKQGKAPKDAKRWMHEDEFTAREWHTYIKPAGLTDKENQSVSSGMWKVSKYVFDVSKPITNKFAKAYSKLNKRERNGSKGKQLIHKAGKDLYKALLNHRTLKHVVTYKPPEWYNGTQDETTVIRDHKLPRACFELYRTAVMGNINVRGEGDILTEELDIGRRLKNKDERANQIQINVIDLLGLGSARFTDTPISNMVYRLNAKITSIQNFKSKEREKLMREISGSPEGTRIMQSTTINDDIKAGFLDDLSVGLVHVRRRLASMKDKIGSLVRRFKDRAQFEKWIDFNDLVPTSRKIAAQLHALKPTKATKRKALALASLSKEAVEDLFFKIPPNIKEKKEFKEVEKLYHEVVKDAYEDTISRLVWWKWKKQYTGEDFKDKAEIALNYVVLDYLANAVRKGRFNKPVEDLHNAMRVNNIMTSSTNPNLSRDMVLNSMVTGYEVLCELFLPHQQGPTIPDTVSEAKKQEWLKLNKRATSVKTHPKVKRLVKALAKEVTSLDGNNLGSIPKGHKLAEKYSTLITNAMFDKAGSLKINPEFQKMKKFYKLQIWGVLNERSGRLDTMRDWTPERLEDYIYDEILDAIQAYRTDGYYRVHPRDEWDMGKMLASTAWTQRVRWAEGKINILTTNPDDVLRTLKALEKRVAANRKAGKPDTLDVKDIEFCKKVYNALMKQKKALPPEKRKALDAYWKKHGRKDRIEAGWFKRATIDPGKFAPIEFHSWGRGRYIKTIGRVEDSDFFLNYHDIIHSLGYYADDPKKSPQWMRREAEKDISQSLRDAYNVHRMRDKYSQKEQANPEFKKFLKGIMSMTQAALKHTLDWAEKDLYTRDFVPTGKYEGQGSFRGVNRWPDEYEMDDLDDPNKVSLEISDMIEKFMVLEYKKNFKKHFGNVDFNVLNSGRTSTAKSSGLKGRVFLFTGFRDKDMEEVIQEQGGTIAKSMSSKVTDVIANDLNSKSSKVQFAIRKGLNLIHRDNFDIDLAVGYEINSRMTIPQFDDWKRSKVARIKATPIAIRGLEREIRKEKAKSKPDKEHIKVLQERMKAAREQAVKDKEMLDKVAKGQIIFSDQGEITSFFGFGRKPYNPITDIAVRKGGKGGIGWIGRTSRDLIYDFMDELLDKLMEIYGTPGAENKARALSKKYVTRTFAVWMRGWPKEIRRDPEFKKFSKRHFVLFNKVYGDVTEDIIKKGFFKEDIYKILLEEEDWAERGSFKDDWGEWWHYALKHDYHGSLDYEFSPNRVHGWFKGIDFEKLRRLTDAKQ